jgi:hypothetical protein
MRPPVRLLVRRYTPGSSDVEEGTPSSPVGLVGFELAVDPPFDVAPAVPDVLADPEPPRALPPVPPLIQGGRRHPEVPGEFLDAQQPLELFHAKIVGGDAFKTIADPLSKTLSNSLSAAISAPAWGRIGNTIGHPNSPGTHRSGLPSWGFACLCLV